MRGSIRQKSKNSWQLQIYTGIGPDGKRRRHFETVRGRKGDAQRRLTELLTSLDKGIYTPPGRLTVAEHLRNWLTGYVQNKLLREDTRRYSEYSRTSPNTRPGPYSTEASHSQGNTRLLRQGLR